MVKIYKEINKTLVSYDFDEKSSLSVEEGSWIDIKEPTMELLNEIANITKIPVEMLYSSLDDEESAHVDIDDGNTLIVLDSPYIDSEENGIFSTGPFVIAYNDDYFITISKHNSELLSEVFKKVKRIEPHKHVRLSLNFLYRLTTLFITYLKKIDQHTKTVEKKLHNSMKNKELLELMDINKTLVYFSTALNANRAVLSKLLRLESYKQFEDDFDLMEDAQIEMNQAIEMCSIYRDILAGMMDAFASIISNNLNIVMKTLAVVTIVISIPTLIASFFGMNFEDMPLYHNNYGFWIVVSLSIVLSIIGAVVLIFLSKNAKRK